jgi:hypothetical protein
MKRYLKCNGNARIPYKSDHNYAELVGILARGNKAGVFI